MTINTQTLEKARILKGLTKQGLAEGVGIHPSTYTLILKGKIQNPPTIKKIADFLGLEMEAVFMDEPESEVA